MVAMQEPFKKKCVWTLGLAVSGGADSTALLAALADLRETQGFDAVVLTTERVPYRIDRIGPDLASATQTVLLADGGKEKPKVVKDLRRGSDGRARTNLSLARRDSYRGRQPFDRIDFRFVEEEQ